MTDNSITVVDYGLGNILSITRALTVCGGDVVVSGNPTDLKAAKRLLIPGVGAFADGMKGLKERDLLPSIYEFAEAGKPILGICLGMQLLLSTSMEFGEHEGLALIPGLVVPIPTTGVDDIAHKIPHVGWNSIQVCQSFTQTPALLRGLKSDSYFYFVHSFTAVPEHNSTRLADTYYNGRKIAAVIQKNNVFGCQFHPEKSGTEGLKLLSNFLQIE